MVEIYDIGNLSAPLGTLAVLSGRETRGVGGAATLTAELLARRERKAGIPITVRTVFKLGDMFYKQSVFEKADDTRGVISVSAEELLFAEMIDRYVDSFNMEAGAGAMLAALFEGTRYSVSYDGGGGVMAVSMENTNKLEVFNAILQAFDCEARRALLSVHVTRRLDSGRPPYLCRKGKNTLSVDYSVDTSDVVTRLYYRDAGAAGGGGGEADEGGGEADGGEADAPPLMTLDSPNIGMYPAPKEAYMTFDGDAGNKAAAWLAANDTPRISCTVVLPFNVRPMLGLGDSITVFCEQIGVDVTLRVIGYTRDLTKREGDVYELGDRRVNFIDYAVNLSDRVTEIVKETVTEVIKEGDTVFNQITEVTVQNVLAADNAMLLNCWVRYLMVEMLETNFDGKTEGGQRDYIRVQDQYIRFITEYQGDEMAPYKLPNGEAIYWTAIGSNVQAKMYFTTTPPDSVYPVNGVAGQFGGRGRDKLTEEDVAALRAQFAVMIHKVDEEHIKAQIFFEEVSPHKIVFNLGEGDENGRGKGFIYKDADGLNLVYTARQNPADGAAAAGTEIGLRLTDFGAQYYDVKAGEWRPIGGGGAAVFVQDATVSAGGVINDANIKAASNVFVDIGTSANAEQFNAFAAAKFTFQSQADGSVTLNILGDAPAAALPVNLMVIG